VELGLIVIAVFALAFIAVTVLRLTRSSAHERAVDIDVVKNGEAEIVGSRVLAFVEDDGQTFHSLTTDVGQNDTISVGRKRYRSTPPEPLPASAHA
jgi:hypothetical protein